MLVNYAKLNDLENSIKETVFVEYFSNFVRYYADWTNIKLLIAIKTDKINEANSTLDGSYVLAAFFTF